MTKAQIIEAVARGRTISQWRKEPAAKHYQVVEHEGAIVLVVWWLDGQGSTHLTPVEVP